MSRLKWLIFFCIVMPMSWALAVEMHGSWRVLWFCYSCLLTVATCIAASLTVEEAVDE